jgi:phosphatidylserine decarboxylase
MSDKLKTIPQYLLPQRLLSRGMGKLAQCRRPQWLKDWAIKKFIAHYGVNLSEAAQDDYQQYACFNDFFTRKLLSPLRPIDADPYAIVSPADGCISEIGKIHQDKLLQAKGHYYSLQHLLGGNTQEAKVFENGAFATIYLSPKDYHRVHLPLGGHFVKKVHIPGKLFSVNSRTARVVPSLFARNERIITFFETAHGKMAVILVGAMIVGHIVITAQEKNVLEKGEELGYFQLGSTVIILFESNQIRWNTALKAGISVKMGQNIGLLRLP